MAIRFHKSALKFLQKAEQEFLEDMEDLIALRAAKHAEASQPVVPLSEVKQMLDLSR